MGNRITIKICRHCNRCKVTRPRRLCYSCYYQPGVRDLYPPKHIYKGNGVSDEDDILDKYPTEALPGTPEKIVVLETRASKGLCLWHPLDAKMPLK